MRARRGTGPSVVLAVTVGLGILPSAVRGQSVAPVVTTRYYAFHSDPWSNLHHFLYQWARAELGLGSGREEVPVPERDAPSPGGAPGSAWAQAVRFYVAEVARQDHFDDAMLELKTGLLGLRGDPASVPPDEIAGIAETLRTAMPTYLATWWPAHDAANRAWIGFVYADVRAYEARWVDTVTRLFGGAWIDDGLRIDASAYANWQGGYTSNGPAHTVIWSRDEVLASGLYGLELVFHESGHASSLGAPLRGTVAEVFRDAGVPEPGNLRHTLLFATAGELVRVIAVERGQPEHVPYIVSQGLTGFSGWSHLWPPVVEHRLPLVSAPRRRPGRGAPLHRVRAAVTTTR